MMNLHAYSLLLLLFLLLILHNADCASIIKTLPGFPGPLPFKLETGYVRIEDSELFYYFVESTGKPMTDPLLIYLAGGPGCSALNGFFLQAGPLAFNTTDYRGGLPLLVLTPYTWTKTSSIIFVDSPVGTGFSYATNPEGFLSSDSSSAKQTQILDKGKWLIEHPNYISNRIYIATDSYSGLLAPVLSQLILEGNAAGLQPYINLIGFVSGSPHTNSKLESNKQIPYAHRMALLSDKLYMDAKQSCNGSYADPDPSNVKCMSAIEKIRECIADINTQNILNPNCALLSPKLEYETRRALKEAEHFRHLFLNPLSQDWWCKNFPYMLLDIWANNKTVQEALHVREGTIQTFPRCNLTLSDKYERDIHDATSYQKNLTNTGLQVLLYTGDHDMLVSHLATEAMLAYINISVGVSWRPWLFNGQVAGYQVLYSTTSGYRLTYATVKGSGHSPTEYFRDRCLQMFERWIHFYPL